MNNELRSIIVAEPYRPVFVPAEERELNEVDNLNARIKTIQETCEHDFRLIREPNLIASLVRGVFVGSLAPARAASSEPYLVLVCLKCSKEESRSITSTCPQCLKPMGEAQCLGAGSRVRYFGQEYVYYSVAISYCTKCSFALASDMWDQ